MFRRFSVILTICAVCAVVIWGVLLLVAHRWAWAADEAIKSRFADFDFAGYIFGMVAVAVSSAGVYVTLFTERATDQMMKLVEMHLIPDPFSDSKIAQHYCDPKLNDGNSVQRSAPIRVIYSLYKLRTWVGMNPEQRAKLLGEEGLDADALGIGKQFPKLQEHVDKKLVFSIAVIISLLYATLPLFYLAKDNKIVFTVLIVLNIMCVVEIAICAICYFYRTRFFSNFEARLGSWRPDIANYLFALAAHQAQKEALAVKPE
ncbi:MAG: hypothetical protein QOF41_3027 [Methylobacteriaceae bacterium]|nr:hypothetical protein [Methylobacteriaceae bacterium]